MIRKRCGECAACKQLEIDKRVTLASVNPPFTHADDALVNMWNACVARNPCATWSHNDAEDVAGACS